MEEQEIREEYKDYSKEELIEAIVSMDISTADIIKTLKEENERLKDLYERTCKHLFNIGNDELARHFQAQICNCNVFTPQVLNGGDSNE